MSQTLIDLMQKTIHEKYHLEREEDCWLLSEANRPDESVKIRSIDEHAFAFSLDRDDKPPLAFLSAEPPKGIAKMCDAIMVCHDEQQCYLFLIEMKTNSKGEYKKQFANGKFFCDWLLQLYKEHKSFQETPIFVGLFVWFPRRSPDKQTTTHVDNVTGISHKDNDIFDYGFEISNRTMIPMFELFKRIDRN